MANDYIFFDNGTFESYGSGVENVYETDNIPAGAATVLATMQRSTDEPLTGAASGKITFKAFKTNAARYCPNFFFRLTDLSSSKPRYYATIFAGQAGKEFIMKVKIMTPSSNPIGSPDLNLRMVGRVGVATGPYGGLPAPDYISLTKLTVADITDTWEELELRVIVGAQNTANVAIVADDETLRVGQDLRGGVAWDYAGTLNLDGVLYIDDITFEEVVACDLAYGTPSYTKTDETAEDAEDGTITVNATSSVTREYSLDNAIWQLSNVFPGLAPGLWDVYVRDVNGCTLPPVLDIPILEFVPPECDLVISNLIVTNETGAGADDGSVTIVAASSAPSRLFSLDGVVFQAGNVFSDLAPDNYIAYVKNNDGGCLVSQAFTVLAYGAPPVGGTLLINQQPITFRNLISWFTASGKINFAVMQFTNCFWDLPKTYRNNKIHKKHYPVVINDEQFSFYIDFKADYSYANFTSLRLDLINQFGVVQQDIAPLSRVFQDDLVKYFIYASVTLTGLTIGIYRLAITDTSTAAPYNVVFVTQEIQLMATTEAPKITARFRFRCSVAAMFYRVLYYKIPEFYQEIRLRVSVDDEDINGEIEQYRAVSNGIMRNSAYELDEFIILEMYYFDDIAHRAMKVFQAHDVIRINNVAYIVKDLYKVQWNKISNLNKATIGLYNQEYSSINRYGNPNSIEAVDPELLGDGGSILL